MPSESDGPNPWGTQGSQPGGPRRGGQRDRPWGGPGGGGEPGGPRPENENHGEGGGNGPLPPFPELDEVIARAQEAARRVLGGRPGGGGRGLVLLCLAVLALWLASGFYRVQADEEGVVLRFGAFVRRTPPGLNYHLPWPIETALTPKVTRVNRIEIGYRSGEDDNQDAGDDTGGRELPQESLMLTGDENIVDVNVAVLWRIADVQAYLFNTSEPAEAVKSVTESVLREVMGRTPIQPALGPLRAQIADEVMRQTQDILDAYHAGVQIVQVLPQKVDPPPAVIESFRDVQRANTDADRMRNQAQAYSNDIVPRARGDAARIVALAEGDKQAAIARATGESRRFLSVLTAYQAAKDVTLNRLYLDTMQDVLSHSQSVVLDDRVRGLLPFLPLGPEMTAASPKPGAGEERSLQDGRGAP